MTGLEAESRGRRETVDLKIEERELKANRAGLALQNWRTKRDGGARRKSVREDVD